MFNNPFSFEGRIGRSEYVISLIIFAIVFKGIIIMDASAGGGGGQSIIILFGTPLLWFIFSQGTKRCQDIGSNGWYQLLPFFYIWLIFEDGANQENILDLNISEQDETTIEPSKEMPKEIGKNRWLHPTDGSGKMEEGLADEGRRR